MKNFVSIDLEKASGWLYLIFNLFKLKSADSDDILGNENDKTPMARESYTRTASVGSFLKTELFRGSSESGAAIILPQLEKAYPRDRKDNFNPLDMDLFPPFNLDAPTPSQHIHPEQLQRRRSKGKKLMSKAFDRFGNSRSKSVHFLRSKSSKDSLLRHVSLRYLGSSRPISSGSTSRSSSRFSFEESTDLINSSNMSVVSANEPASGITPSFILYPEISVVPEVASVDTSDEASIWVSVVVTAVLQRTGGYSRTLDTPAPENGHISQSKTTPS